MGPSCTLSIFNNTYGGGDSTLSRASASCSRAMCSTLSSSFLQKPRERYTRNPKPKPRTVVARGCFLPYTYYFKDPSYTLSVLNNAYGGGNRRCRGPQQAARVQHVLHLLPPTPNPLNHYKTLALRARAALVLSINYGGGNRDGLRTLSRPVLYSMNLNGI